MKGRCQQLFNELAKSGALFAKHNCFNHLSAPDTLGALVAQSGAAAHSFRVA
jgi:hypothetical protein